MTGTIYFHFVWQREVWVDKLGMILGQGRFSFLEKGQDWKTRKYGKGYHVG